MSEKNKEQGEWLSRPAYNDIWHFVDKHPRIANGFCEELNKYFEQKYGGTPTEYEQRIRADEREKCNPIGDVPRLRAKLESAYQQLATAQAELAKARQMWTVDINKRQELSAKLFESQTRIEELEEELRITDDLYDCDHTLNM